MIQSEWKFISLLALTMSFITEEIRSKQDSSERIRLLQDRLGEIRKAYSSLKAEVAGIDRKKKRLRKKREGEMTFSGLDMLWTDAVAAN